MDFADFLSTPSDTPKAHRSSQAESFSALLTLVRRDHQGFTYIPTPLPAGRYLSGAEMGYAKAAELNGYPGPMHVLELSDQLHLSADQKQAVGKLMERHKADARAIGVKLVEAERTLDALFQSGTAEPAVLAAAVNEAARLQGSYRLSHLETHLRAKELLSPEQVALYATLRGYGGETRHKH